MRSKILTVIVAALLPLSAVAQDDMYFVPTKEQVKAEKEARKKVREAKLKAQQKRDEAERIAYIKATEKEWRYRQAAMGQLENRIYAAEAKDTTYYSGINKSVDDYNRHRATSKNDTTVYSKDSIASDIIDFAQGNGYPKANQRDTVYVFLDEDDYQYSRSISRWDNYYWWHGAWGRPIGWYAGWYGPYGPWYDPWYDPWYYGPGWYHPYWAYDPWYYDSWYYDPWYYRRGWHDPWYYTSYAYVGGGGHLPGTTTNISHGYGPQTAAQKSDSHFYGNHVNHGYVQRPWESSSKRGSSNGSGGSTNYQIAARNGDATSNRYGNHSYSDSNTGWSHRTYRGSSNSSTPTYNNSRSYSNSNNNYSSSNYSSGSSYSGGGSSHSSSSSSSGGGFSGGGSSHSGHGGGGGHR